MLQPYRIDLTEIVQKLEDKCYEFIFNKTRSSSASRRLLFPSSSTRAFYPEPLLSKKKKQQQKERKTTQIIAYSPSLRCHLELILFSTKSGSIS